MPIAGGLVAVAGTDLAGARADRRPGLCGPRNRPIHSGRESEVEFPVFGPADEGVPFVSGEDQRRAGRVFRVADGDGLVHESYFDAVITIRTTSSAFEPLGAVQVDSETFGRDFHNGSSISILIMAMDSSGVRAVDRIVSKMELYFLSSSAFSRKSPPVAFSA